MSIASIIHFSQTATTALHAEAIAQGARKVNGTEVRQQPMGVQELT